MHRYSTVLFIVITLCFSSCASEEELQSSSPGLGPAKLLAGSYVPDSAVIGLGSTKGSVSTTVQTFEVTAGMVRLNQSWGTKEVLIDLGTFDQTNDFGPNGSITLVAETLNYPIQGGAYPVLSSFYSVVSPSSTVVEYVNLTSNCSSSGIWQCFGGSCSVNAACTVQSPSGFASRSDWDQHQFSNFGYMSTNSFPRCDNAINGWSTCPTGTGWGALPSGHYYAKYILNSDWSGSVSSLTATLKVTMIVKKDTQAQDATAVNGGLNLNLILVGDQNVNASHSAKGADNLDMLLKEVNRLLSVSSNANVFLNSVKVYEWTDANGAEFYSQIPYTRLGDLFEAGSGGVDSSDQTNNLNVFIVSDIEYSANSNITILGLSGAILGPPVNGTQTSGVAFSSSDLLGTFNPGCGTSNCSRELLESEFLEMAATMVHEIGHYLGLNHPSESPYSGGQEHDQLSDTPVCNIVYGTTAAPQRSCYYVDSAAQSAPLTTSTCKSVCDAATTTNDYMTATKLSTSIDPWTSSNNSDMPREFCPAVNECQFNHAMWYTTKNRRLVSGVWYEDGNLISPQSSAILQWNSFLR